MQGSTRALHRLELVQNHFNPCGSLTSARAIREESAMSTVADVLSIAASIITIWLLYSQNSK